MGPLTQLIAGKLVAFDTGPLIYYIEEHPNYLPLADELFGAFDSGAARGMTSVLTLQEVLVKPLREGRNDLAEKYRQVLSNSVNVRLHEVDQSICEIAARLRAKYSWLRTQIEFFDQGVPIGEGTLTGAGEYQLVYKKVALGRHWLAVKTTDNLGHEALAKWFDFFVNGLASVEITDPKAAALLDRPEGEISVAVHASHPNLKIKEVKVYLTAKMAGYAEAKATPAGNDLYVARIDCSFCKREVEIMGWVIDDSGVETRSPPVSFKLREPPVIRLHHYDGEDLHALSADQPLDFLPGSTLVAYTEDHLFEGLNIVRMDFFANGKLIDTYRQSGPNNNDNNPIEWDLAGLEPGPYKVQAIATDSDGSIGKSVVVEIVIKKRR